MPVSRTDDDTEVTPGYRSARTLEAGLSSATVDRLNDAHPTRSFLISRDTLVSPIPEPAAAVIMTLALSIIAERRRKRAVRLSRTTAALRINGSTSADLEEVLEALTAAGPVRDLS